MDNVVQISSKWFLAGCAVVGAVLFFVGHSLAFPAWFIAAEVLATVIGLFVFGSTKYQLDKNALTYGMVLVIGGTFAAGWRPQSSPGDLFHHYFLTLHGLDQLFHADTMLFILGLTFFVAVIAQTRLLESISFTILEKYKGRVFPTIALLTAIVSAASGVLDGVSMIGLMIRTMAIILVLSKAKEEAVLFSVIVSTIVTTVCGMWLAYGEPPNLIMKANLDPHLTNFFFLRYCLPVAIGTYFIVYFNLRKHLGTQQVPLKALSEMKETLREIRKEHGTSQLIAILSFIPFIGLLVAHAVDHRVPLFAASFAGFAVGLIGIYSRTALRRVAIHEAIHEYKEYLFLFPLFLSITLLQKSGFFDQMAVWVHAGIETLGTALMAFIQFTGAVFLSALLDNNVVADFASRALHDLDLKVLHLFAMAQIAGYAAGGCWTHIGSAQSVVAYAFIRKEINKNYTPFQWIKAMTPVIVEIFILMVALIYGELLFL